MDDSQKKKLENYKLKLLYGIALLAMFAVGYGTGQAREKDKQEKYQTNQQSNYTTNQSNSENKSVASGGEVKTKPTNSTQNSDTPHPAAGYESKTVVDPDNCPIKGNISASGSKIFHVSGGAFYEKTNPEECFQTETEAKAAGFRKSYR